MKQLKIIKILIKFYCKIKQILMIYLYQWVDKAIVLNFSGEDIIKLLKLLCCMPTPFNSEITWLNFIKLFIFTVIVCLFEESIDFFSQLGEEEIKKEIKRLSDKRRGIKSDEEKEKEKEQESKEDNDTDNNND